jgi:excisionase family DNA binding protein
MAPPSQKLPKRLMTIQEVTELTGLSVSTLYKMVSQHRVPFVKLGGALRFHPVELEEWIKLHSVTPEQRS